MLQFLCDLQATPLKFNFGFMKTIIIIIYIILSNNGYITEKIETPVIHENIEYCQNVYFSGQNPLNEKCDFAEVEYSLKHNY